MAQRRLNRPIPPATLALALATALQCLPAAHAADAATPAAQANLSWNLPAAPLGTTLLRIASQSGRSISVPPSLVQGLQAPAVTGQMSAEQAALAAIAGHPLELQRTANGTLTVRGRSADTTSAGSTQTLAPVNVTASVETAGTAVSGYVARRSATVSKTDTPLLELPQMVNVITREQITSQGANNTAEALRYTPGVLAEPNGFDLRYDWSFVRGYATYGTQWIDGLSLPGDANSYAVTRLHSYLLDRVEVVKGPNSVLYGKSLPGGMINQITKRPQFKPHREIELQTTGFGGTQFATDLTGPLTTEGDWAYRLVALRRNMSTRIDNERDQQTLIAPSLTWKPSAATQLTLLAHYQRETPQLSAPFYPSVGTLRPNAAGNIPRDVYLGEPGQDSFTRNYRSIGYEFSHQFNDTWKLRQNLRYSVADQEMFLVRGHPANALQADGRTLNRVAAISDDSLKVFAADTQLESRWNTGPLQHTVLTGIDYSHSKPSVQFGSTAAGVPPLDLFNPVYGQAVPRPAAFTSSTMQDARQVGLYAQDQIRYGSTIVTVGLRHDESDVDSTNRLTGATVKTKDSATTGRIGATYVFDNGLAPYAAYSTSFRPTLGSDRLAEPFKPEKSRQAEVGLKYEPVGGWGFATLSLYELELRNGLTTDPANTNFRVQTGEQRVRGLEFEAKVNLDARWNMLLSYAYSDSEITKANDPVVLGREMLGVPRNQASIWAIHRLAAVPGLELGAGARYTSSYTRALRYEPALQIPSLFLMDASALLRLGELSPSLRGALLRLTVSNLADKRSVAYCQNLAGASCNYAAGRTVTATLSYQW